MVSNPQHGPSAHLDREVSAFSRLLCLFYVVPGHMCTPEQAYTGPIPEYVPGPAQNGLMKGGLKSDRIEFFFTSDPGPLGVPNHVLVL